MSIAESLITKLLAKGVIDLDDINDCARYLEEHDEPEEAHIVRCLAVELASKEREQARSHLKLVASKPDV